MDPFKNHKNLREKEGVELDPTRGSERLEENLESETGFVEGRVSEVSKERPSEQGGQSQGKKVQKEESKKVPQADFSDRMALRERLLKAAPSQPVMRAQVKKILMKHKEKLESDLAIHRRKKNYRLLNIAIMELRLVIRQLEELAKASYEALKEIWLKVVHHFA